jgi:hypothetical protein
MQNAELVPKREFSSWGAARDLKAAEAAAANT